MALGFLITALSALTIPLVLSAVRDSVGEVTARRYLTVLVLAPYAIWVAVSLDGLVATLGAAAIMAGARASRAPAGRNAAWAVTAGLLVGVASLFSYSAPWLGLSIVCVYFARRRALLNLASGLGALLPVLAAEALGFGWADGLVTAETDYASRVAPYRPVLWWSVISVVVLLLAAGPVIVASARKLRDTAAWPFLVGAGAAVVFSIVAGLARGGVEHAWLPFFPWLTVAAVAPEEPTPRKPQNPATQNAQEVQNRASRKAQQAQNRATQNAHEVQNRATQEAHEPRNPATPKAQEPRNPAIQEHRQLQEPQQPLLLVALGAAFAVVVEAVLVTPW